MTATALTAVSEQKCFGGTMGVYSHASTSTGGTMRFSVFRPQGEGPFPVLTWLAGLTCTEETFMIKAGAQRFAAREGLMLVAPDTSPRGHDVPGEAESWDFGVGAGFYLDATEEPWARHWRMESYVTQELPALVEASFPADMSRQGISGHSMGGHGALTLALRHKERWRSVSAFAPISAPTQCPWGEKAFSGYLGQDRSRWAEHDACELLRSRGPLPCEILVDQGTADQFLERELKPGLLEEAAREVGQRLTLRRQEGYDHSYWFIQTFIEHHIAHHAQAMRG
ncbi:S-formylglutathione hydrolase [Marinimicrococcus flavescens]|uniref:S-formylglutathione hydrolase n=1 Tax=Marinimicrococcus flavescens TaxID=3031815 RepID=A0AAP3V0L7_9PROT|nr:S-formylglutathione hydrolase [Marinimicrococcus flavescens]